MSDNLVRRRSPIQAHRAGTLTPKGHGTHGDGEYAHLRELAEWDRQERIRSHTERVGREQAALARRMDRLSGRETYTVEVAGRSVRVWQADGHWFWRPVRSGWRERKGPYRSYDQALRSVRRVLEQEVRVA